MDITKVIQIRLNVHQMLQSNKAIFNHTGINRTVSVTGSMKCALEPSLFTQRSTFRTFFSDSLGNTRSATTSFQSQRFAVSFISTTSFTDKFLSILIHFWRLLRSSSYSLFHLFPEQIRKLLLLLLLLLLICCWISAAISQGLTWWWYWRINNMDVGCFPSGMMIGFFSLMFTLTCGPSLR